MKKGFTLAEVLVTLAVIGIVAALTIPALLRSYQDNSYHSAWKKKYSEIKQAYLMLLAEDPAAGMSIGSNVDSLLSYLKTIKSCGWGNCDCWHEEYYSLNGDVTNNVCGSYSYIMADGTFIKFTDHGWGNCTGFNDACFHIDVDVNGSSGPNTIGKDIYGLYLMKTDVQPMGQSWDNNWNWDCIMPPEAGWDNSPNNNGYGCSLEYLQ